MKILIIGCGSSGLTTAIANILENNSGEVIALKKEDFETDSTMPIELPEVNQHYDDTKDIKRDFSTIPGSFKHRKKRR